MQINNIALATQKCKKPCRTSFMGLGGSSGQKKMRYKHYEEMGDDVLKARSIISAHQKAQKSGKMHLYKAIPTIATGIIATSLAITRPGKLSDKTVTGLGFLASVAGIDLFSDIISSKSDKETKKKSALTLLGLGAVAGSAVAMFKGKGNKVTNFLTGELNQLTKEINKTKLAKATNKYVEPFLKKNPLASVVAPILTALSTSVIGGIASVGLLKGISHDISKNAIKNYEKGKIIQQIARDHFDSLDAIEV